jgi:hypothetical protein
MGSELIRLADGVLVEVEVPEDELRQCSGNAAHRVAQSFEQLGAVLHRICDPLKAVWAEMNKDLHPDKAEVEFGLSFEGEGSLFVTKAKAGSNLTITLTLSHPLVTKEV